MLQNLNELTGFAIHAEDGVIGQVKDFYFDDRHWVIRYLVVELEPRHGSRKILLTPSLIKYLNRKDHLLAVDLSTSEINNRPRIDTQQPASQQYEIDYLSYYGYAFYWDNNSLWDSFANPTKSAANSDLASVSKAAATFAAIDRVRRMYGDRHLRSCVEMMHYHVQAMDSEVGHLDSILIDEDTWAIHYAVVNTQSWWPGQKVLASPEIIKDISWGDAKIHIDMNQRDLQSAPPFDVGIRSDYHKVAYIGAVPAEQRGADKNFFRA